MWHVPSRPWVPSILALALGLSACSGGVNPLGSSKQAASALEEKIAFSSTRDNDCPIPVLAAEIYVMNRDTSDPVRLTNNACDYGDGFAALSPTGSQIVFDRISFTWVGRPVLLSDLFIMNRDGSEQAKLMTRGTTARWSPDGQHITFHASASGPEQLPINSDPGAATPDSDVFVAKVGDLLEGVAPTNITEKFSYDPSSGKRVWINEDADWSPDGQKIVFTRKSADPADLDPETHCVGGCDYPSGEVWVMDADGSTLPTRLTHNDYEERAPTWSRDGSKIVYMCRAGPSPCPGEMVGCFQICAMNAEGGGFVQLTSNNVQHLAPFSFSPGGNTIMFHSPVPVFVNGQLVEVLLQLFTMPFQVGGVQTQLTSPPGQPGHNAFADWGYLKVNSPSSTK